MSEEGGGDFGEGVGVGGWCGGGGGRGKVGGLGMRADLAFGMILVPFLAFGLPSLISGITQKICVLCFVVINSVFELFMCLDLFGS